MRCSRSKGTSSAYMYSLQVLQDCSCAVHVASR